MNQHWIFASVAKVSLCSDWLVVSSVEVSWLLFCLWKESHKSALSVLPSLVACSMLSRRAVETDWRARAELRENEGRRSCDCLSTMLWCCLLCIRKDSHHWPEREGLVLLDWFTGDSGFNLKRHSHWLWFISENRSLVMNQSSFICEYSNNQWESREWSSYLNWMLSGKLN